MAVSVADSTKRQLLFEVGSHLFAADARCVREVLEPRPATPIPGAGPEVIGLVNLRGTLMTAAELATLLDITPGAGEEEAFVVIEEGRRRLVLKANRVLAMLPYPADGLDVGSELLEALGAGDVVAGVGEYEARPYYRLNVRAIFERVLGEDLGEKSLQHGSKGGGSGT